MASSSFADDIKTPIYRLVNAADIVPRVPPAYVPHLLIGVLEILNIPVVSAWLVAVLERVIGYRHHGDMRYLTACKADYSDLRVISNPSIIDRAVRFVKRVAGNWQAPASDHAILNYLSRVSPVRIEKSCLFLGTKRLNVALLSGTVDLQAHMRINFNTIGLYLGRRCRLRI